MIYDIQTKDGAISYRIEGYPVGHAGSDIPDRIETALKEEFDGALEVRTREITRKRP